MLMLPPILPTNTTSPSATGDGTSLTPLMTTVMARVSHNQNADTAALFGDPDFTFSQHMRPGRSPPDMSSEPDLIPEQGRTQNFLASFNQGVTGSPSSHSYIMLVMFGLVKLSVNFQEAQALSNVSFDLQTSVAMADLALRISRREMAPVTASKNQLDASGLLVIRADDLQTMLTEGKVLSSCTEQCNVRSTSLLQRLMRKLMLSSDLLGTV
jgi:hypothetical protein